MTKRSDGERTERVITGTYSRSGGETRDARAKRFAGKRVGRPCLSLSLAEISPTRRRRRTAERRRGRTRGAKGIPQSALRGSVNATLKSAYKSLRRRFPSARGVPIGLKLVRQTAVLCRLASSRVPHLFVSSARTLTRLVGNEGEFFCNRCVSATAYRFNHSRILSPLLL